VSCQPTMVKYDYVKVVPTGTQQAACAQALAKDQMVNINGSEDQFYRYKMPQLVCTVPNAHASKMVKTSLVNIEAVSTSLQRPPSYLPNYIGYTWSAKAEYNAKKNEGENCYVSGNYKAEELNEVVTKFVKEWVLCPKCNNPELNMKVKKKKGGQVWDHHRFQARGAGNTRGAGGQ
jgi:translation initiation factor 2 beta subunit (eIF-2beta)/eIF-5